MKKIAGVLIMFLSFVSSNLSAQSSQDSAKNDNFFVPSIILPPSQDGIRNTSLISVWQRCRVQQDSLGIYHINTIPLFKFISIDNTIMNMGVGRGNIRSVIISQGKYQHPSDSIYIEYLGQEMPIQSGENNKIRVKFLHDDLIELDFSMPTYTTKEYWIRVVVPETETLMVN